MNVQQQWIVGATIILMVLTIIYWTTTPSFKNLKDSILGTKNNNLKELDVIMFVNPKCPWCVKTLVVLENDRKNLTIVDITTPEGSKIAENYGVQNLPVPNFISKTNKTSSNGYKASIDELVSSLTIVSEDDLLLFAREGCGYCTKAKEAIQKEKINIQIIDTLTKEGKKLYDELLPKDVSGVPVFYSLKTKKHVVGFNPDGTASDMIKNIR